MQEKLEYIKNVENEIMRKKTLSKKALYKLIKHSDLVLKYYGIDNSEIRSRCIRLVYLWARRLDDYVDGDIKLVYDLSLDDEKNKIYDFLQERLDYVMNYEKYIPDNVLDKLIGISLEDAKKVNVPLDKEIVKLFDMFYFDLFRRCDISNGEIILSSDSDIVNHYYNDFAESCYLPWVQLVGGNEDSFQKVRNLCYANRIYYNLQDLVEDISSGLINISLEDFEKYGISYHDLLVVSKLNKDVFRSNPFNLFGYVSDGFRQWILDQLSLGNYYLSCYMEESKVNNFSQLFSCLSKRENLQDITFFLSLERKTCDFMKKLSK